jgi:hypothetical protein
MISGGMSRKSTRYGKAPPERPRKKAPKQRSIAATPKGHPIAQPPAPRHVGQAPRQRRVGKVPNPRKPRLVRDVGGGTLGDLFVMFPDLRRPPRPTARVPTRIARRRSKH